jgi:AmmeMemoRadiSam system protein B
MSERSTRRPAAVAGTFYPGDRDVLTATVDGLLDQAAQWSGAPPKALVVPHAGYVYSGPIAASGYAALRAARGRVQRVVLLGPAHFVSLRGLAVPSVDELSTPLGDVPIDADARRAALELPGVVTDDAAHAREHSLEVHLPFLQRVLDDGFSIVPFVVGQAAPETVAAVLDRLWGGDETLVVVSTDLSHYLDHATASARDRTTADAIAAGATDAFSSDAACGAYPVRGLLTAATRHGLHTTVLDVRNSGDTAGSRDRVVGYGAFALSP